MRIVKPILVILLLLCLKPGFSQIETTKYAQSGDTCVPASVDDYNRLIKYFMAEKEEPKQLFKFDLIQYALFRPNIAFERKIKNNLKVELAFLFDYGQSHSQYVSFSSNMLLLAPTLDLKYYHNINQRKDKGKNTNGFSGNYISTGFGSYIFKYNVKDYNENLDGRLIRYYQSYSTSAWEHLPYNENYPKEPKLQPEQEKNIVWRTKKYEPNESIAFVRVGYGIQRRIGNIGYVGTDLNFGVGTNYDFTRIYLMPELSIKAGFALSSFKKK